MTEQHFRPVEGEQPEAREQITQKRGATKQQLHDGKAGEGEIGQFVCN